MHEYIHMRLRGGLPQDRTKFPTLSMMLDATENALVKLGWSYTRFLFRNDRWYSEVCREYAEKFLDHYRHIGIDEKYFNIDAPFVNIIRPAVENYSRDEILFDSDPEQEKIIRDLCRRKGRYSRFRIIYQGIVLPHEHVTDCYIRCAHGGASVCISSAGGWDVGIARRVAGEFADAVGMTVDRRWYRMNGFGL